MNFYNGRHRLNRLNRFHRTCTEPVECIRGMAKLREPELSQQEGIERGHLENLFSEVASSILSVA